LAFLWVYPIKLIGFSGICPDVLTLVFSDAGVL